MKKNDKRRRAMAGLDIMCVALTIFVWSISVSGKPELDIYLLGGDCAVSGSADLADTGCTVAGDGCVGDMAGAVSEDE